MITYGIDISTAAIGIGILDNDKLLHDEAIIMPESPVHAFPLELRADIFRKKIELLFKRYPPDHIAVEEPLRFAKKNGHTVAVLQRFNAMCCYVMWNLSGKMAQMVPVRSARAAFGIYPDPALMSKAKTKYQRRKVIKRSVIDHVSGLFENFIVRIKRTAPEVGTDDRADAIVVALFERKRRE